MRVLVTGSSGLIGSALIPRLTDQGHTVVRLIRRGPVSPTVVRWDPASGTIDREALRGIGAAVHLAGESIVGRWTPSRKAAIRESRVEGTRRLCDALIAVDPPPKTFLCASAVGFYGNRGEELLDEDSPPGFGFLADTCREWEGATERGAARGMRVVNLRFGTVLSRRGGALKKMLLPFQLGLGGPLGSGNQYWSWITLDDVVGAIEHTLNLTTLHGPVNVVSPEPVTNRQFTSAFGRALFRPAFAPVPAFALRALMGEMADELLLASQRALPKRLEATGYRFRHPELSQALRAVLQSR